VIIDGMARIAVKDAVNFMTSTGRYEEAEKVADDQVSRVASCLN
jgi:hypothetical protein